MTTRKFSLNTVLTVTTGRLLTKPSADGGNGIGDLYDILGFVTQSQPYTHELGKYADVVKPQIYAKYPELEAAESELAMGQLDNMVEKKDSGKSNYVPVEDWLSWVKVQYNFQDEYELEQMEAYESQDPLESLINMMGVSPSQVMVVDLNEDELENESQEEWDDGEDDVDEELEEILDDIIDMMDEDEEVDDLFDDEEDDDCSNYCDCDECGDDDN